MPDRTCSIEGCSGRHYARGWCRPHYKRWSRLGSPTAGGPMQPRGRAAETERFWSKVDRSGECWIWTAGRNHRGYGQFRWGPGGSVRGGAHRFSYELHFGPIPDGLVVCHRCDNPPCVRPDHLFVGTAKDNAADRVAKDRSRKPGTHCLRGHEFTPENTYSWRGVRTCRTCQQERVRRYLAKKRTEQE